MFSILQNMSLPRVLVVSLRDLLWCKILPKAHHFLRCILGSSPTSVCDIILVNHLLKWDYFHTAIQLMVCFKMQQKLVSKGHHANCQLYSLPAVNQQQLYWHATYGASHRCYVGHWFSAEMIKFCMLPREHRTALLCGTPVLCRNY
jgi:hypothetical protein